MNNFYLASSVVFPLFCMMALGYVLRLAGIFNQDFLKQLNNLCFKVFLPLVLFSNIYQSDFYALLSPKLIVFAVGSVVGAFLVLMLVVPLFEKNHKNCGVMVQGIFRSNFILFGIPITTSLYGVQNAGITAILLAFVIPVFNLLSIITLEFFSGKKSNKGLLVIEIIKNPLIIGAVAAFFFVLTGFRMPTLCESTILDISKVATPLALIILGGNFQFRQMGKHKRLLRISVIGKLVIMPGIFLPLSIALGFRNMELVALLALFASPTAVSTFTMAQSAKANDELAGQIVVVDSILSILSIFVWISILKGWNVL